MAAPPWIFTVLITLGAAFALRIAFAVLPWIYAAFLRPAKDLRRVYGTWAVVTGPTDGIGKGMAIELARRGMNLVLVGRSAARLAAVAKTIADLSNGKASENGALLASSVATKIVVVDLAVDPESAGEVVGRAVEGLDVGVLINNAGLTDPESSTFFHEQEEKVWRDMLAVNVVAATSVAHAVIRIMAKRGKRGAVVNVGSGSSEVAGTFPLRAVYAATKAYIYQLSKSLSVEYKSQGIDVQCQIPMFVLTKMNPALTPSLFAPTAEQYGKAAVRHIGYETRSIPYWSHAVEAFFMAFVPTCFISAYLLAVHTRERNQNQARKCKEKDLSAPFS